jgi:hypothetical protein
MKDPKPVTPPPVRDVRDCFVVGVKPAGISAVVCADGVRRTVVEMIKDAEAKEETKP